MAALRQELEEQKTLVTRLVGLLDSKFGEMNVRIQQAQNMQDEAIAKIRSEIGDFISVMTVFKNDVIQNIRQFEQDYVTEDRYQRDMEHDVRVDAFVNEEILRIKSIVQQEANRLENVVKTKISHLRSEILDRPSEAKEVKQELLKAIDIHKVNSDGITTEIEACKHAVYVAGKHIEDLYTQVDRIKQKR